MIGVTYYDRLIEQRQGKTGMARKNGCKNCRYYVEHYIKENTRYSPIGGHCTNDTVIESRKRDKYRLQADCSYWESNESGKSERKERIKETLRRIEEQLEQIAMLLKEDEDPAAPKK